MFPLNIPNALTMLRILAVPVIVVALLDETPNGDVIAAVVFALAALTDGLDGYIARRREQVTTFGKLMDPLADKLLVVAALISLVSLDRLAAWVAMVIIAREFAVTGLRSVAAERGVVISASWLGKVKTALQVGAIFALIAFEPTPLVGRSARLRWRSPMTVICGADYFFGLRRHMASARGEDGGEDRGRLAAAQGSSSHSRVGDVAAGVLAGLELGEDLGDQAGALGDDGVAVDRLQVLLAGEQEAAVAQGGVGLGDAADHLAHDVLDEARVAVRLLDDRGLVGALHQLVDLRAHRRLDDVEEVAGVDLDVGRLSARPRWSCADPALVVGGDGDGSKMRSISSSVKPSASRRSRARSASTPWAQGQAVMPCASTPVSVRVPRSDATAVPKACRSPAWQVRDAGVGTVSG